MHKHQLILNTHKAPNVPLIHPPTKPMFQAESKFLILKTHAKGKKRDDIQPIARMSQGGEESARALESVSQAKRRSLRKEA